MKRNTTFFNAKYEGDTQRNVWVGSHYSLVNCYGGGNWRWQDGTAMQSELWFASTLFKALMQSQYNSRQQISPVNRSTLKRTMQRALNKLVYPLWAPSTVSSTTSGAQRHDRRCAKCDAQMVLLKVLLE